MQALRALSKVYFCFLLERMLFESLKYVRFVAC